MRVWAPAFRANSMAAFARRLLYPRPCARGATAILAIQRCEILREIITERDNHNSAGGAHGYRLQNAIRRHPEFSGDIGETINAVSLQGELGRVRGQGSHLNSCSLFQWEPSANSAELSHSVSTWSASQLIPTTCESPV